METIWLPSIRQELCTGCGNCIAICPVTALTSVQGKAVLSYPEQCTYCALCEDICPAGAIELPFFICFVDAANE